MPPLRLFDAADLRQPGLEPYATLRRTSDQRQAGRFVAEGEGVVRRLLESDFGVESVLVVKDRLEALRPAIEARPETIDVYVASTVEAIHRVTGYRSERAKAVGRVRRALGVADLLRDAPPPRLFVALDGVTNAENVGVVVRNAAGLASHGVLVGATSCSVLLTRAIRTSMGTVFSLPFVDGVPLLEAMGALRAAGVALVAADVRAARPPADLDFRRDTCLVLGAEGHGISPEVLAACDVATAIPMAPGVDSLNVASAAAAILYEAQRQRAAARA